MRRIRVKYGLVSLLMLVMSTLGLSAQTPVTALPGTYGTEFWAGFMSNNVTSLEGTPPKFTIYAVAEEAVTVVVALGSAPGTALGTIDIPVGGGFGKFDGLDPKTFYIEGKDVEKVVNKGVVVYAKDGKTKFSCYALSEVEGTGSGSTRDATLVFPKELLWKEYYVQTYHDDAKSTQFIVVGTEQNTRVTIYPSAFTTRGGAPGNPIQITLNVGDVYLVMSKTKEQSGGTAGSIDLSGSTVCSDRPVAVFNGNEFVKIPNDATYSGNHTFEQTLPQMHLGSEFCLALAGSTLRNQFYLTATVDNTKVQIVKYNSILGTPSSKEVVLNAGESLTESEELNTVLSDAHITADKPILSYSYLSCGGANQETYYDIQGHKKEYNWGHPTNAMVVPWSHRVKEMSFYTDSIVNQSDEGKQKYFVQIITSVLDINKITLDGSLVDVSNFTTMGTDPTKAYANIQLTTHGKHRITTDGSGFTGFVMGMTSESRAYQYTLGFNPPMPYDSLYIENPEPVMSPASYDLPYVEDRGWLQRQLRDWPKDEERLDTAIVCDSTTLDFFGLLPDRNAGDSVVWKIYKCDNKSLKKQEPPIFTEDQSAPDQRVKNHKLEYQFILDDQKKLDPSKRDPFQYYSVEMERYKNHIICTELDPDPDTLRTMVRVNRIYNDTTWRIVCETDTIHFFYDDYNHPGVGEKAISIFKFETKDLEHDTVPFHLGADSITRIYTSVNGCDSIVTLMLWGCDTIVRYQDTTMCQDSVRKLNIKIDGKQRFNLSNFKFRDVMKPYDTIFTDVKKSINCIAPGGVIADEAARWAKHCPEFLRAGGGCKDSMTLHLTIMPKTVFWQDTSWCTGGNPQAVFKDWIRKDSTKILPEGIRQDDPRFNDKGEGIFIDTIYWTVPDCAECPVDPTGQRRCIKEVDILTLRVISNKDTSHVVHICRNQEYEHMKEWPKGKYVGKNMPLGEHIDTCHVEIKDASGAVLCEYWDTLHVWVHPVYQDTLATMHDYQSVCRTKPAVWANHIGDGSHEVWDKVHGKRVLASALPTDKAGEFTFVDSLKTTTCPDCKQGVGCDSIWTLHLTVNPDYIFRQSFQLCDNDTLMWQGTCYYGYKYEGDKPAESKIVTAEYETMDYEDTARFMSMFTCDSIHTMKIRLNPTYVTTIDTAICENQTYWFFDIPYHFTASATPYILDSVAKTETCECDSGVLHTIMVYPVYMYHDVDTTCQVKDGTYVWENHPVAGEERRQIWMVDSAHSNKWQVWTDEIPLSKAGRYTLIDSLQSHACAVCNSGKGLGCDSVYIRDLKIIPTYFISNDPDTILLSTEDTVQWSGKVYAGYKFIDIPSPMPSNWEVITESKRDTVKFHTTDDVGTYLCDSIRTTFIQLVDIFRDTTWAPVCANCTYDWVITDSETLEERHIQIPRTEKGERIPQAGEIIWYYDSLTNRLGFDSIYNLQLTGFPYKDSLMRDTTCQGADYVWKKHEGHTFYIDGQPVAKIPTDVQGWITVVDSMKTDTVFLHPKEGYIPVHCDSVWTLELYIAPTYNETYNAERVHFDTAMCSNDTLLWNRHLFAAYDYDEAAHPLLPAPTARYDSIIHIPGTAGALFYDSTFTAGTVLGCDSTNYLTIHIEPSYFMPLRKDSIGDNDSTWSFGGKGGTLPLITRKDIVDPEDYTSITRVVIDTFFIDTIPSTSSCRCDSIVRDSVWIFPTYRYVQDTAICSNNDWDWRPESPNADRFTYMNLRPSGTYYDSLLTQQTASNTPQDSVYVLRLTVLPAARVFDDSARCKNDTMYWNGQKVVYPTKHIEVNYKKDRQSKCDSVIDLTMTWYDYYHYPVEKPYPDNDSICRYDSYKWISEWDETLTPHTMGLRGEKGERFDSVPTDTLGWIVIYDSLQTTSECHCDSIFKLRYFVKPSYRFFETEVACTGDTVHWRDSDYVSDKATIVKDLRRYDVKGIACDSIYYLTLTFNQSYDSLKVDTICGTDTLFKWRDHELGDFVKRTQALYTPQDTALMDRLETGSGCDSIFRLQLNVRPIYTYEWNDTICVGERYKLVDKYYDSTGVYSDTLINHFGCDSILKVNLAVVPITKFDITPVIACANDGTYTLRYRYNTDYAPRTIKVVYDSIAQANRFPKDTTFIPVPAGATEVDVDVFHPQTPTDYLRPNIYSAKAYFINGTCKDQELLRQDYLLTMQYPSWVAEQHWTDAICVLNKDYNGGYEFFKYQWYKNGEAMMGETKSYLFVPQYLDLKAEYQVLLTRTDDSIAMLTCPVELTLRDSSLMPTKPYVSVVPSLVFKESPYTNIMCNEAGSYTIYNPYGVAIQSGRFVPGEHNAYPVRLSTQTGVYLFYMKQDNHGEERTVKVVVQ